MPREAPRLPREERYPWCPLAWPLFEEPRPCASPRVEFESCRGSAAVHPRTQASRSRLRSTLEWLVKRAWVLAGLVYRIHYMRDPGQCRQRSLDRHQQRGARDPAPIERQAPCRPQSASLTSSAQYPRFCLGTGHGSWRCVLCRGCPSRSPLARRLPHPGWGGSQETCSWSGAQGWSNRGPASTKIG